MKLNNWTKINNYDCLGAPRARYQYTGNGYFPEVLSRLEEKIGHVLYADCTQHIIHITIEQESLLGIM